MQVTRRGFVKTAVGIPIAAAVSRSLTHFEAVAAPPAGR